MLKYIGRRLVVLIPMLLGVSIIIFSFLRLSGTDPALQYLHHANIPQTAESIAVARGELGLDKPIVEQYIIWIRKALVLDFGTSYMTGRPVLQDLIYFLPHTLRLSFSALLFTMVVSLPLGMWAARHHNKWQDGMVQSIAFLGVSMPNFWTGFLLVLLFSVNLKILPPMGFEKITHYIMPVISISFMSIAINSRLLRCSMLEVANSRYVTYGKMRGLGEREIERKHIFRNGILPIVTSSGMHVGELLGGSLIVESIFGWPGIGRYAITALGHSDFPVIQAFVVIMTMVFVICNLIIDILYAKLDPRIRLGEKE